ncbi:MAG: PDZ domain-containing protein, partial [Pseudomonadota bacterium]
VGDWVVAIGNPFGLGGTVTAGIISAMNRDIAAGPYDDFIQTDASINRGNSGGPLFNLDGQVIGVNTAIISPSGGSIGIGFSIPSEIAQNVIDQLLEFGETRRGWLGVRIQTVTDEIAETLGLDAARGALVAEVTEGSPADNAGIEPGDLIMTFDGKPIPEMRDLPRIVADTKIGKTVPVEVLRRGKKQTYDVKVERLDEAEQQAAVTDPSGSNDPAGSEVPALGLTLSELTPTLRKQYSLANEVSGVLITDIQTDSPARGTLRTGDVIVEVAQQGVKTPTQVRDQIKTQTDDKKSVVLFLINRGGDLTFLTVRLENS